MNRAHKITIIISGSIAAVKVPLIISPLKELNIKVQFILTKHGAKMVTKESIEALSGFPVVNSLSYMQHIEIARNSDLIAIIPASANIIAKIAHGIADDIATTTILASNKKVILVPAMNTVMWENQATQENIQQLKRRGFIIMSPNIGKLACDEYGIGRIPEPLEIVKFILANLENQEKTLKGYNAIVTAGSTREYLDSVRYISNNSSGLQGYLLAEALMARGAQTTLISGITHLPTPLDIKHISIISGQEMLEASLKQLPTDIFIAASGVCDFKPVNFYNGKIKKEGMHKDGIFSAKFLKNPDILSIISGKCSKPEDKVISRPKLVIGFAMESENLISNAIEKLKRKGCDWIFANSTTSANSLETHLWFIKDESNIENFGQISKKEAAHKIVNHIEKFFTTSSK